MKQPVKCATTTVEVWIALDSAGDYAVGSDRAAAAEAYEANVQALTDAEGLRYVKATLELPLPEVIELEASLDSTEEKGDLVVK